MVTVRSNKNPIITPADVKSLRDDFEVVGVFNAGVTRLADEVILLLRVAERPLTDNDKTAFAPIYDVDKNELFLKEFDKGNSRIDFSDPRLIVAPEGTFLTSISHLRLARSRDGINFEIEETAAISAANEYETFGLEDPRITEIGDTYYINYVGVSPAGVTTCLAVTKDFKSYTRLGVIFCPDNKDVVIFPERINDRFYAIHRPASGLFKKNDMWLSESPDLLCWGSHRFLMSPGPNEWDRAKIGAGAVPFRTDLGWVEVYHGADSNNRYSLGAALLDADRPWKVLARTAQPIFEPQTDYECSGFFGNVVFTCGLLCESQMPKVNGKIKLYYGAADTSICYAELDLSEILSALK
jgi:predicted GH43/DUF377 family glycosyl hydrolase